jgi:hypothetical protein
MLKNEFYICKYYKRSSLSQTENFYRIGAYTKNIQLIFNTFAKYTKGTNTVKDV